MAMLTNIGFSQFSSDPSMKSRITYIISFPCIMFLIGFIVFHSFIPRMKSFNESMCIADIFTFCTSISFHSLSIFLSCGLGNWTMTLAVFSRIL